MKMLIIVIFLLAGCAVRCDDTSNYFVIEMPEDEVMKKDNSNTPLQVYWNVPTMQCRSKNIHFGNLFEKYGIIQNKNDDFRGDKIAILYDPGLFPALLRNQSSGKLRFRNGGVPQEGDIQKHMDTFRSVLELSIPDERFDGIGIIDFESWRPIFRQNFGVLVPYKDVSYEIERKRHRWWLEDWVKAEAKSRFEESSRRFMQTTISLAKQLRPLARWGYYGFPHCFNGNPVTRDGRAMEKCAGGVLDENDRTYWLWSESSALYPSVYSSKSLDTYQLTAFIRGRVAEAHRVSKGDSEILPYFWFRYRDGGYLSERDLKASLQTFQKTGVNGFIIWGSSNDVNTVNKCNELLSYVDTTLGPAIAKYTKTVPNSDLEATDKSNETETTSAKPDFSQTTVNNFDEKKLVKNCSDVHLDPENCWDLPENYTQDIKNYVDEHYNNSEINSHTSHTTIIPEKITVSVENIQNDTVDAIDYKDKAESSVINKYEDVGGTEITTKDDTVMLVTTTNSNHEKTTEIYELNLVSTTEYVSSTTENNYFVTDGTSTTSTSHLTENKNIPSIDVLSSKTEFTDIISNTNESSTTQIPTSKIIESNFQETEETTTDVTVIFDTTNTESDEQTIEILSTTETNKSTNDMSTPKTTESDVDTDTKTTTEERQTSKPNTMIESTITTKDNKITRNKKKMKSTEEDNETLDINERVDSPLPSGDDQVYNSAYNISGFSRSKNIICFFFYFYSVSKCLCKFYNQCFGDGH